MTDTLTRPVDADLTTLDAQIEALPARTSVPAKRGVERVRADLAALRFHLARVRPEPILLAILGGTGTGKSTLVNRLLDANLSATSYRRTFTAGPVAVAAGAKAMPFGWLGIKHPLAAAAEIPARGQPDALILITHAHPLLHHAAIIDTPDLDGDQPAHHVQADRTFRWADAVLFLVTPEKYQMTELLPYYRLASRYGVPTLHVMNKAEEPAVVDDYASQVQSGVFAIPRDDSTFQPPDEQSIAALKNAIAQLNPALESTRTTGIANRTADVLDRLRDQVLTPLRTARREADRAISSLRAMETPLPGVDVNPLTQALQRRLQQRSVLYLMGPGRVLDRVRQMPGMLARLPRTTWELLRNGRISRDGSGDIPPDLAQGKIDFRAALVDQFNIVQSRIDDVVRSAPTLAAHMDDGCSQARIDPERAGEIADEEIASLQDWLEQRWNATPRDTAVIEKLVRYLPGGRTLTKWSEAAPYLLAVVVATHHAFFGPIDLLVIGGFSVATWVSEKLSNEVAARARAANNAISSRFTRLAHQQIQQTTKWLDAAAASTRALDQIESLAERIQQRSQG